MISMLRDKNSLFFILFQRELKVRFLEQSFLTLVYLDFDLLILFDCLNCLLYLWYSIDSSSLISNVLLQSLKKKTDNFLPTKAYDK